MLVPLLSEADSRESAEGSIDPLGIYAIADTLRAAGKAAEPRQHGDEDLARDETPGFLSHG